MMWNDFFILIVSFLVSLVCVALFRQHAIKKNIIDVPGERSSHSVPTPRGGGVVFVIVWCVFSVVIAAAGLVVWSDLMLIVPGAVLVAGIGFLDDLVSIKARWRFAVHFFSAILLPVLMFLTFEKNLFNNQPMIIFFPVFVLFTVWSINLYNFMDGTDGFASTQALFVFVAVGGIFWWHGVYSLSWLSFILSASVGGFLVWNWPKAKIFMGDVGSGFLGYLVAALLIVGYLVYGVPFFLGLIMYSVFLFDATATLLRRFFAGDKWYLPHRLHAYQRLIQSGWSHQKLLHAFILVNLINAFFAVFSLLYGSFYILFVAVDFVIILALYIAIEKKRPMYSS